MSKCLQLINLSTMYSVYKNCVHSQGQIKKMCIQILFVSFIKRSAFSPWCPHCSTNLSTCDSSPNWLFWPAACVSSCIFYFSCFPYLFFSCVSACLIPVVTCLLPVLSLFSRNFFGLKFFCEVPGIWSSLPQSLPCCLHVASLIQQSSQHLGLMQNHVWTGLQ